MEKIIDDIFSLWNYTNKDEINAFIETANRYHPTIRFTAEIYGKDTCIIIISRRLHLRGQQI